MNTRLNIAIIAAVAISAGAGRLGSAPTEAEISSYRTVQPRYGEKRTARTVLIFVTEHLHRDTRIKVEDYAKTTADRRVHVLKLNRALHFTTGIYEYSVMTSVFSALQPELGRGVLYPMKISIAASEWCGNFYEQLLPDGKGAARTMHSYFEAEGDKRDYLAAPPTDLYEDNLPVLIREYEGEFLPVGQKREFAILPALWESRMTHKPLSYEKGWVRKDVDQLTLAGARPVPAFKWTWQVGDRVVTYWTGAEPPHYILQWRSSTGESGDRIASIHLPYWQHNKNQDLKLRQELGLPAE